MPYAKRRSRRAPRRAPRKSFVRTSRTRFRARPRRRNVGKGLALRSKWENPVHQAGLYKLTYRDDLFSLSTTAAGGYRAIYVFSGNSCYDPDVTGAGVQPYGFDQLCGSSTFYQTYRVLGSSIRVRLHPTTEYTGEVRVILIPFRTTVSTTDVNDVLTMPHIRVLRYSSQQGMKSSMVSNYASSRYMFADFNPNDPTCSAAYNASPAQRWYWNVWVDTLGSSTERTIQFDVSITYYTRCGRYNTVLDES